MRVHWKPFDLACNCSDQQPRPEPFHRPLPTILTKSRLTYSQPSSHSYTTPFRIVSMWRFSDVVVPSPYNTRHVQLARLPSVLTLENSSLASFLSSALPLNSLNLHTICSLLRVLCSLFRNASSSHIGLFTTSLTHHTLPRYGTLLSRVRRLRQRRESFPQLTRPRTNRGRTASSLTLTPSKLTASAPSTSRSSRRMATTLLLRCILRREGIC